MGNYLKAMTEKNDGESGLVPNNGDEPFVSPDAGTTEPASTVHGSTTPGGVKPYDNLIRLVEEIQDFTEDDEKMKNQKFRDTILLPKLKNAQKILCNGRDLELEILDYFAIQDYFDIPEADFYSKFYEIPSAEDYERALQHSKDYVALVREMTTMTKSSDEYARARGNRASLGEGISAWVCGKAKQLISAHREHECFICFSQYEHSTTGRFAIKEDHKLCLAKKYTLFCDIDLQECILKYGKPSTRDDAEIAIKWLVKDAFKRVVSARGGRGVVFVRGGESEAQFNEMLKELVSALSKLDQPDLYKSEDLNKSEDNFTCVKKLQLSTFFELIDGVYMHYNSVGKKRFKKDMKGHPNLEEFVNKYHYEKIKSGKPSAIVMFRDKERFEDLEFDL